MKKKNSPPFEQPQDSQLLRRNMRRQRRELSVHFRRRAGRSVVRHVRKQPAFIQAKAVGLYLDAFGELPTQALMQLCFALRKSVYLPVVISNHQPLAWARIYQQRQRFTKHRFGMQQPTRQRGLSVTHLDVLFMPLVAFDRMGQRLGMGGGFYDRTLSICVKAPMNGKRHHGHHYKKPLRIGLAYDFQQVGQLQQNSWDVPLHAVTTPTRHYRF
ncbi:5-formyltetrahydrofolate cyclo-ligase [Aquirhabdus sp.]|uniref:5-formyltetrahydrofolate cyclo-ligase n=1 Tax=Aquirhabdus sp. TaxID=2824160 RepID=UPI00396CFAA2